METYDRRFVALHPDKILELEEEGRRELIHLKQGLKVRIKHLFHLLQELGEKHTAAFVDSLLDALETYGYLTPKQLVALEKIESNFRDVDLKNVKELKERREKFMQRLLELQEKVKGKDEWLEKFLSSILDQIKKSRPLSGRQKQVLQKALLRFKVAGFFA